MVDLKQRSLTSVPLSLVLRTRHCTVLRLGNLAIKELKFFVVVLLTSYQLCSIYRQEIDKIRFTFILKIFQYELDYKS